jgi:hypothetical protein
VKIFKNKYTLQALSGFSAQGVAKHRVFCGDWQALGEIDGLANMPIEVDVKITYAL